jgi:hypothetical protein
MTQEMTCDSGCVLEIVDVSISKLFLSSYLIAKFVVELPLIPMVNKKLCFPTAMSSATTWSYASIFIFWDVRYALRLTKSSTTKEKIITSMFPISSEIIRGSLYLQSSGCQIVFHEMNKLSRGNILHWHRL